MKTDLVSADATFVATDRAAVRDHKIPPEFFKRESCDKHARVFLRIKWSGPNRKSGICAYSPARTFQAIYCIHDFNRGVESDGTTDVSGLKVLVRLSGMTQLVIDVKLIDFESTSGGSALKISPGLSGMTSPIIGVE